MTAASVATGIGVSALSACVNGITAQAGRWKWRFASKHTATTLKMGVSKPCGWTEKIVPTRSESATKEGI